MIVENGDLISAIGRRFLASFRIEARHALDDVLKDIENETKVYPPETAANRPAYGAYGPYYDRGVGQSYKRQDGSVSVYTQSENLGGSWERDIHSDHGSLTGTVGPTASYGPYVHDRGQQAPFHGERGWRTLQGTLEKQRRGILLSFGKAAIRALRRLTQ